MENVFLLTNNVGLTRAVDIVFVVYFFISIDDRRRFSFGKKTEETSGDKKKSFTNGLAFPRVDRVLIRFRLMVELISEENLFNLFQVKAYNVKKSICKCIYFISF